MLLPCFPSRFSRWSPWGPSLISEQNDFNNSESLCCSHASHQVSAQSNLQFGRRCRLKNSRWLPWQSSWISERNNFSNSESFKLLQCLLSNFSSIEPTVWKEMSFEEFQDGCHGGHHGYRNGTILAIMNLYNA